MAGQIDIWSGAHVGPVSAGSDMYGTRSARAARSGTLRRADHARSSGLAAGCGRTSSPDDSGLRFFTLPF